MRHTSTLGARVWVEDAHTRRKNGDTAMAQYIGKTQGARGPASRLGTVSEAAQSVTAAYPAATRSQP